MPTGGILNGGIYLIIRRRKFLRKKRKQEGMLAGKESKDFTVTGSTPEVNRHRVTSRYMETSLTESELNTTRR